MKLNDISMLTQGTELTGQDGHVYTINKWESAKSWEIGIIRDDGKWMAHKPKQKDFDEYTQRFKWKITKEPKQIPKTVGDDTKILQEMYNSEINFQISCFFDVKIDWKIGDELNGYTKEGNSKTISLAIWNMAVEASIAYPNSEFSKYFKTLQC